MIASKYTGRAQKSKGVFWRQRHFLQSMVAVQVNRPVVQVIVQMNCVNSGEARLCG